MDDQRRKSASGEKPQLVTLRVDADQLSAFFALLQRGVTMQAVVGCSLQELLCDQLGIPADYVAGRITTIFLDNSPVDKLDATIREGARIALSAAMPGLVGAVLRRSGFYAALRQGITHAESSGALKAAGGTVRIKLFNLLLAEIGPLILAHGVLFQREELDRLLGELSASIRTKIASSCPSERDVLGQVLLAVTFQEKIGALGEREWASCRLR